MGNVTRNLSRLESACECGCGLRDPHPMLVAGIQHTVDDLQEALGLPVQIWVSGPCRCASHNKKLRERAVQAGIAGPAEYSHHMPHPVTGYCDAHDCIYLMEVSRGRWVRIGISKVLASVEKWDRFANGGVGLYLDTEKGPRIHHDVRTTGPARWGWIDGRESSLPAVLEAARKWTHDQQESRRNLNTEE